MCLSICRTRTVDLWCVNKQTYNFFVSGTKFTNFFISMTVVDKAVFRLSISLWVPKISAAKVKSCPKLHQIFGNFLPSQILRSAVPPKVVPMLSPSPSGMRARQVEKFHGATSTTTKVIRTHLLIFKPISDSPLKKNCKEDPIAGGVCTSKTWSFSSACKNLKVQHPLGAQLWSSKKVDLGGYNFTTKSL